MSADNGTHVGTKFSAGEAQSLRVQQGIIMGTQIESYVVGLRCELRECGNTLPWHLRVTADTSWLAQEPLIRPAVAAGWAFALSGRLLSYCPQHAGAVWTCRCVKGRPHMCPTHDAYIGAHIWDLTHQPAALISTTGATE